LHWALLSLFNHPQRFEFDASHSYAPRLLPRAGQPKRNVACSCCPHQKRRANLLPQRQPVNDIFFFFLNREFIESRDEGFAAGDAVLRLNTLEEASRNSKRGSDNKLWLVSVDFGCRTYGEDCGSRE